MRELFHDLSDWLVGFADSDWAIAVLGLASFIEAIFFPIPPDPLMLGIAALRPEIGIWLGVWVTATSVLGAMVGHYLGKRLGRPLLLRFVSESKVARVEGLYQRWGGWATLIAAFTPIPYKVFAISAGVMKLDRRTFALASLVGRGLRFITLGALVQFFGASIQSFISQNFEMLTIGVSTLLVGAAVIWAYLHRRRKRTADAAV